MKKDPAQQNSGKIILPINVFPSVKSSTLLCSVMFSLLKSLIRKLTQKFRASRHILRASGTRAEEK